MDEKDKLQMYMAMAFHLLYENDQHLIYNGAECKGLPSFPKGTYPDLIIHKRGRNDANLLVMEFKTYWNDNRGEDKKKIKEFMDPSGKFKYKYGISVLIGIKQYVSGYSISFR